MAGRGNGALWVKLYELELQLRLMRAARGEEVAVVEEEEDDGDVASRAGGGEWWSVAVAEGTCRGRQYDAYMRRRDARRHTLGGVAAAAASLTEGQEEGQTTRARGGTRAAGAGGRPSPLAVNCAAARDTQEVKRSLAMSTPTTPRKESVALPRARTVNTGAAAAKPSHQRRSNLGAVPSDFGDSVTPRPFLRRGSGTGGATTTTPRLREPPSSRGHDLPPISDAATASPRRPPPPRDQIAQAEGRRRHHSRSLSELPLHHHHHHHHTAATAPLDSPRSAVELPSPQPPRARKQSGSPETTPRAILSSVASAGDSHKDFAKGLKKLLSFVRKSSSKSTVDQHSPARPAAGKPVMSTGWPAAAASPVTA